MTIFVHVSAKRLLTTYLAPLALRVSAAVVHHAGRSLVAGVTPRAGRTIFGRWPDHVGQGGRGCEEQGERQGARSDDTTHEWFQYRSGQRAASLRLDQPLGSKRLPNTGSGSVANSVSSRPTRSPSILAITVVTSWPCR